MNSEEAHRRHNLESSLFSRVRHWTDVFGWLRLVDALRVLSSPTLVGLVALSFGVWVAGLWLTGGGSNGDHDLVIPPVPWFGSLMSFAELLPRGAVGLIGAIVWTLAVWAPAMLWVSRQGALLTAGRLMEPVPALAHRTKTRLPIAWLAIFIPLVCTGLVMLPAAGLSLFLGWVETIWIVEIPLAMGISGLSLVAGLLVFGGFFAVPLAVAAIANEEHADALDALSRGYEGVLRRPLHLVGYLVVSGVMFTLVVVIAMGVQLAAWAVSAPLVDWLVGERGLLLLAHGTDTICIWFLLTLFFALQGGVYLLVRKATGDQEVEDLWVPPPAAEPPLPKPGPVETVAAAPKAE